ncbi:DNA repair protein RadC [Lactobacillus ultunensis DSM 16047]|nr:DNA repair protein RadC [Lactobacillus ultunensis DSM 16047]
MFEQFKDQGITDFKQLILFLRKHELTSFDELVQYITGPDCPDEVAIAAEEVFDRLRMASPKRKAVLTSSVEVGNYLADKLVGHKQEELWALYIDNGSHVIAEKKLFQGTLNRSVAHPREIFRWAVIYGCSGIFIAHNHPSGKLMPSSNDFELTEDLNEVAKMMKIDFLDHFIVGQGHYLSMREEKLF